MAPASGSAQRVTTAYRILSQSANAVRDPPGASGGGLTYGSGFSGRGRWREFVDSCLVKLCGHAECVRVCPFHNVKTDFVGRLVIAIVPSDDDYVANSKPA